jgi:hypothetical protein
MLREVNQTHEMNTSGGEPQPSRSIQSGLEKVTKETKRRATTGYASFSSLASVRYRTWEVNQALHLRYLAPGMSCLFAQAVPPLVFHGEYSEWIE